jgi:nicotinamidase-related amidase
MLAPLVRAIDLFAGDGQPIFYTVMLLRPDDEQFARFGDRYCVEGTPGAEIIPELQPLRGPVIVKHKHSAFFETDLDDRLKECGVRDLYLAGLQTQICVMTTAADANFRGYRPTAIRDCVVSTRERTKTQALQWISKYVGNVIGISDVEEGLDHG